MTTLSAGMPGAIPRRMTAPRRILPNTTYLVTRRCTQREFLLTPSETVNHVFLYLLAVAAERFHIDVHAFCVLSNHYHFVVTDRFAQLPAFHQYLDGLVARALNAALGRWESFWAPNSYSAIPLETEEDVLDKIAYVLVNPVAAGLVRTGRDWPGLWSAPELIDGDALEVVRPEHFFSPRGSMPERARLRLVRPPQFKGATDFHERLGVIVAEREAVAREQRSRVGGFLGVKRVLSQNPHARPRTFERRRDLNPRVAGRDRWRAALHELRDFWRAYRAAWEARVAGRFDAVFPCGTYQMRVLHGAPCVPFSVAV
jgi:REP element-mobilizing transposase RayT